MEGAHSKGSCWIGVRFGLLLLVGCASTPHGQAAPPVIPVNGILGAPCQNLGTVVGESESKSWGSGGTTAEQLASQATADAMQRAARGGATHIFLSPVTVHQRDGAPFSATMTGVAFRCPPAGP
jgi:hypothetical protein